MRKTKSFETELKSVGDGGSIVAYASTFDLDPDSYGDIVAPGAFRKSLERWEAVGKPIPLLYGHRTDDPKYNIGAVVKAEEDAKGLRVEAIFDANNPTAQEVRELVKQGRLYQLSFAYDVLDWGQVTLPDGRKANELRELDIFEVSLVQIPANQHAQVVDVKSDDATAEKKATVTVNISCAAVLRQKDDEGNVINEQEFPLTPFLKALLSGDETEERPADSKQAGQKQEGDLSEVSTTDEKGAPATESLLARIKQIESKKEKKK